MTTTHPHDSLRGIDRRIAAIAIPAIVANIAIPLLGLIDTAIAGHLGAARFIGAVAVGSMMMNVIYWVFEFLRMTTSGLTAQAHGAGDTARQAAALHRSLLMGALMGVGIVVLQVPLRQVSLWLIGPGEEVRALARHYFHIVVWGAPAVLATTSIKGWLLGMQDARAAMHIAIGVNVLNVAMSLVAVYGLGMGFTGIATGTLVAVWTGLALALWLLLARHRAVATARARRALLPWGRFFSVSGDIFARSLAMMAVTLFFTSAGARSGDVILAVNAMMMQLFLFYSYFMDGIAFAGEAVVGHYHGMRRPQHVRRCVQRLFRWAAIITVPFVVAYAAAPRLIYGLLTSVQPVVECAMRYRWWCAAVPVVGMAAFVWDGVFVGLTLARGMLVAVVAAAALFFMLFFALPAGWGNDKLWLAFLVFLATRGVIQGIYYRRWRRSPAEHIP